MRATRRQTGTGTDTEELLSVHDRDTETEVLYVARIIQVRCKENPIVLAQSMN